MLFTYSTWFQFISYGAVQGSHASYTENVGLLCKFIPETLEDAVLSKHLFVLAATLSSNDLHWVLALHFVAHSFASATFVARPSLYCSDRTNRLSGVTAYPGMTSPQVATQSVTNGHPYPAAISALEVYSPNTHVCVLVSQPHSWPQSRLPVNAEKHIRIRMDPKIKNQNQNQNQNRLI